MAVTQRFSQMERLLQLAIVVRRNQTLEELERKGDLPAQNSLVEIYKNLLFTPLTNQTTAQPLKLTSVKSYSIDLPSGVDPGFDQVDGFVETWYDQSGNSNDAVQATAGSQPKIVDAGVLVTGGLDFDGVDDSFTLTNGLTINPSTSGFSSFIATKFDKAATGSAQVFLRNNNSNPKHAISFNTSGTFRYNLNDGTNNLFADTGSDYGDNSLSLFSTIITGQSATGLTHFVDGSQDGQFDTSLIGDTGSTADTISWPAFPFGGVVQEIIFYPSDQSSNRVALETNINGHYSKGQVLHAIMLLP